MTTAEAVLWFGPFVYWAGWLAEPPVVRFWNLLRGK